MSDKAFVTLGDMFEDLPPESMARSDVHHLEFVQQMGDTEIQIRKSIVMLEDEVRFSEATTVSLSNRDRDRFLDLLDQPPAANPTLKRAASKQAGQHG